MYARDRSTPQLHQSSHRALSTGERLRQYGYKRVCDQPECTARLSRYNPSDTCSVHAGWTDPRQRQHG